MGLAVYTNSSVNGCLYTLQAEQATMTTILVTMHTHAHVIITLVVIAVIVVANRIIVR